MGDLDPDRQFGDLTGSPFDDGLFQTAVHTMHRQKPRDRPKSVSQMRAYTTFDGVEGAVPEFAEGLAYSGGVPGAHAVDHHDPGHRWAPLHGDFFSGDRHVGRYLDRRTGCSRRRVDGCACPPGRCSCPRGSRCAHSRAGFAATPAATPYYQEPQFWQPRWVDSAGPETAVWHPYSISSRGTPYFDQSSCSWRQMSPRR
jgi:hypothetical protein